MSDSKHIPSVCYYCGSPTWAVIKNGERFQVACRKCGVRGPIADTEDGAMREWNVIFRPAFTQSWKG